MGIEYSCEVLIAASFGEKDILRLIQKGFALGFTYYERKNYEDNIFELPKISDHEAVKLIIEHNRKGYDDFDVPTGLAVGYQDTCMILRVNKTQYNSIEVSIWPYSRWYKKFDSWEYDYIDLGRHMQLLIQLCEDFRVFEIKTVQF